MSEPPSILTVPLARGWKKPERSSQDSNPVLIESIEGREKLEDSKGEEITCSVCRKHQSRYTCPRCQAPYCSVSCYQSHTDSSSSDADASACTEAFYKARVASILQLEASEQKDNAQNLIRRQYETLLEEEDLSDHLYDLLQALEETDGSSLSQQELMELMPPALRDAFERDLQNGQLQDLVLEPWHPWWRPEITPDSDSSPNRPVSLTTLDERLLRIPPFSSMHKGGNMPLLLFNLMDILYSFCWTTRLYHGTENASKSLALEASSLFISNSHVLGSDARYTTMEEALTQCAESSTRQYPASCNASWTVLVEDCAMILVSHRLVGRALLESMDLIRAAIRHQKALSQPDTKDRAVSRLRSIRKKMEFFASWSQQFTDFGQHLREELLTWSTEWKHPTPLSEIESLQLPQSQSGSKAINHQTQPLMVEVETKRNSD